ncbi:hypothetical protein [Streptomyces vinaceus]|uniref:hypothetical protein n=1 Tax=Streptomyces vinaceus TaxID=1960 RepID=UPI003829225C
MSPPPQQAAAEPPAGRLRESGLSAADIAEISGISITLVRRLLKPAGQRPAFLHRSTSEAILGAAPDRALRRERALPGLIPADRAAAALQSLAEQGWPTSFLAGQLGTTTHTIAAIRGRERRRISIALDRRIQRLTAHLRASTPADYGIATHRSRRAQAAARQRNHPRTSAITVPGPRQTS